MGDLCARTARLSYNTVSIDFKSTLSVSLLSGRFFILLSVFTRSVLFECYEKEVCLSVTQIDMLSFPPAGWCLVVYM